MGTLNIVRQGIRSVRHGKKLQKFVFEEMLYKRLPEAQCRLLEYSVDSATKNKAEYLRYHMALSVNFQNLVGGKAIK